MTDHEPESDWGPLKTALRKIDELEAEVERLHAEKDKLKADLDDMTETYNDFRVEYGRVCVENDELERQLAELAKEMGIAH